MWMVIKLLVHELFQKGVVLQGEGGVLKRGLLFPCFCVGARPQLVA